MGGVWFLGRGAGSPAPSPGSLAKNGPRPGVAQGVGRSGFRRAQRLVSARISHSPLRSSQVMLLRIVSLKLTER